MPLLVVAMLCASVVPPRAAAENPQAVDAGWILAKLVRPVPSRTGFVELRDSKLLKAPLRISGEYRRPDADTLVREVRAPYAETTTLRAGEASIARPGKSSRSFSLSRAPELAGLQASFGALLSGDRKRLEQHFTLASEGSRERWTLLLAPKDAALAAKVRAIALYGRGAELRCIEMRPAAGGGEAQRTLLAGAARGADAATTAAALAALCHASQ